MQWHYRRIWIVSIHQAYFNDRSAFIVFINLWGLSEYRPEGSMQIVLEQFEEDVQIL